jgi:hypothetical protein
MSAAPTSQSYCFADLPSSICGCIRPVAVGIGSALALWPVAAPSIMGGPGLLRILPMRWASRLAALLTVVRAGFTRAGALH